MHIEILLIIAGFIALWLGANLVVNAAIKIAKSLSISGGFIGLTVLSIGTSLPEIFAHLVASFRILKTGDGLLSNMVVATNIGSNIVQITLIVGLVGLLTKIYSDKKILKIDFIVMLAAIVFVFLFSLNGFISRTQGIILAVLYIIYLIYLGKEEKIHTKKIFRTNYIIDALLMVVGFALLLGSAHFVLDNAIKLTDLLGWSGSFVGAIIIGVGTSLPELTTAFIGITKGRHAMSLGTLVGSNITNPLMGIGLGAAISGYSVAKDLIFFDIPFYALVSLFALSFFWNDLKLSKKEAATLISLYLVYVFIKIKFFI